MTMPFRNPLGGLPALPPAAPALTFLFFPHPPSPLPGGKGGFLVCFAGATAPGTPALNRLRHLQTVPNRYPETEPKRHHSQGAAFFRFCGKPWVQPRGCKGRSPLHKETISLPLPAGKGGGGMGAKKYTKGRAERQPQPPAPPPSTTAARSAGDQKSQPHSGYQQGRFTRHPPCAPKKSKRVPGAIPPRTPKNHCRYVSSP